MREPLAAARVDRQPGDVAVPPVVRREHRARDRGPRLAGPSATCVRTPGSPGTGSESRARQHRSSGEQWRPAEHRSAAVVNAAFAHIRQSPALRFFFGRHSDPSDGSQDALGIARFSGSMPRELRADPPPGSPPQYARSRRRHRPRPATVPRRRRSLALPAVVAALALARGRRRVGYAAGRQRASSAAASPGTASTGMTLPGHGAVPDQSAQPGPDAAVGHGHCGVQRAAVGRQ